MSYRDISVKCRAARDEAFKASMSHDAATAAAAAKKCRQLARRLIGTDYEVAAERLAQDADHCAKQAQGFGIFEL